MIINYASLLWILTFSYAGLAVLQYSDLEEMGYDCPEELSCDEAGTESTEQNCMCDKNCVVYNDCCVDAKTRLLAPLSRKNLPFSCMPYGVANSGVYAVYTCAKGFSGSTDVQSKCQSQNNISDPLMSSPVSDKSTGVTYWNRYCAICNNVDLENVTTWNIRTRCNFPTRANISNEYVWEHIEYKHVSNKWGIYVGQNFKTCEILFDKPAQAVNFRSCKANAVSNCPKDWKDLTVKINCLSYAATIYDVNNIAYRNPHCALCHGITADNTSCFSALGKKKKIFNIAFVLDVNTSDGDIVGMKRRRETQCASDQKYDPFVKRCRNLVCPTSNQVRVNGTCQSL